MYKSIATSIAIGLAAAAFIVAVFFPDPLSRNVDTTPEFSNSVQNVEPGLYTKNFVAAAIDRYEKEGRDGTFAYYNSAQSP